MSWRRLPFLFFVSLVLGACDPGGGEAPAQAAAPVRQRPEPVAAPAPAPAPAAPVATDAPLVVFLGDSLTAGFGLEAGESYPALLERRFVGQGTPIRVLNAGVSGDTTAGGRARLDWLLRQKPDILVVGLGGNDGLRALDLSQTEKNLRDIVRRAQAAGAEVLLLGMQIPPNYGPEYTRQFQAMYPQIARDFGIPLVPFLLEGVGGIADLNQADAIHPTAKGQEIVANNVEPYLRELLEEEGAAVAAAR